MEVVAGPTVGLKEHVFLHKEEKAEESAAAKTGGRRNGFSFIEEEEAESSESSSIGADSSSEEDQQVGDEDEAHSTPKDSPLGSLESLNESLPIKRGLSNFFIGKSKSFASLSDVGNVSAGGLAKPENPFNKRRRIVMACKSSWSRRASCCSFITSLPRLTVVEGEEEEEEEEEMGGGDDCSFPPLPGDHRAKYDRKMKKPLRSPRSFSLSDLQHA